MAPHLHQELQFTQYSLTLVCRSYATFTISASLVHFWEVLDYFTMGDYEIPQYPKNGKWSDTKCLLIASQESFPAIVRDPKVQKNIISRYLNFYLGGKIQKGLTARDLAFAVISILPISLDSEEFIWTKSEYSDDGKLFFLTPEDKLKYEIDTVVNKRTIFKNEEQSLNDEQFAAAAAADEADAEEEQNINRIDLK
ncbi:jg23078 [Pararge aegeria aegeria]|uniref:Jg23078 protein n=1 Tax=Pararge aegeria aegeria TaxID=348720 RepID=A0A8S4S0T6_9NEOP|nr:jg23078 [Pararge aegeria aegeria]